MSNSTHNPLPVRKQVLESETDPDPQSALQLTKHPSQKRLKIVSYNLWDNKQEQNVRLNAILNIIKKTKPDVACLFDASAEAFRLISTELSKTYLAFQIFLEIGDLAGIVFLCNLATTEIQSKEPPYYIDLPEQARMVATGLIFRETGTEFQVAAAKLDDHPDHVDIREKQMETVLKAVHKISNLILVTEINSYKSDEPAEDLLAHSKLTDSWIKLGCPSTVKYTYDGRKNPLINGELQLRHTRILYRGLHRTYPISLALIGQGPISNKLNYPPSPFYGLMSTFKLS